LQAEPVTLTWGADEFIIPPNRILVAIARVEDVITFTELADASQRGAYPLGKIASTYGNLLRYAGAPSSRRGRRGSDLAR
jgi:hypothetical protein